MVLAQPKPISIIISVMRQLRQLYLSSCVIFKEPFIWFSNSEICLRISEASLFKAISRRAVMAFRVLLGGGFGISTAAALKYTPTTD